MQPTDPPDPDDELKAENELIKLKLELEHGMNSFESSSLKPTTENQWLKYIYDFENQSKNAKRIKLYDFIGRPEFKKTEDIHADNIVGALNDILSVMEKKGVTLDCLCEYDASVVYRFITDELFEYEMDDISIEGMTHNFIYEEFHPNHDYDLRQQATGFIERLFGKNWNAEFDSVTLAKTVTFNGKEYNTVGISNIILAFQVSHLGFHVERFNIVDVSFDLERNVAEMHAELSYTARSDRGNQLYQGACVFHFSREWGYWSICDFQLPGFEE